MSKLPGFDQLAKVRQLRGLDLAELFGDAFQLPTEPEIEDIPLDEIPDTPKARREYFGNIAKVSGGPKPPDKDKAKRKKQAAKKARKKNRR